MATKTVWAFHIHFCRKRTRQKTIFLEEKIFFLRPQTLLHPSSLTYMGSIFSSGFSSWKKIFWQSTMSVDRKSALAPGAQRMKMTTLHRLLLRWRFFSCADDQILLLASSTSCADIRTGNVCPHRPSFPISARFCLAGVGT